MMNIALFGPPGAGKGTQSAFLIEEYKLFHISTGDLLRKELAEESELGLKAKNIIARGELVSDEIIVQIIEKTILDNKDANGFLFDGFPRTYIQAYILEGLLIKLYTKLNCLISVEVSDQEAVNRLVERGKTSGRLDDTEAVIRNRLKEYHEKTEPVLNFYKERNIFYGINGENTIPEVNKDIETIVNKELSKKLMNVVLLGYPGSGRGTQGIALAKKYGLEYVETGKILDEEVRKGSELGKKMKDRFDLGELIPDEFVVPLIEKKIESSQNAKGFIFKGFPSTLVQSYILDGILKKHDSAITKVIEIEVDPFELIRRLDERSRKHNEIAYISDTQKIIKRLMEHRDKTIPVINKYKATLDVAVVNGDDTSDNVFDKMSHIIESGFKNLR
jgi:adenylate kinase